MTLREICQILQCRLVCGEQFLDEAVRAGCGADLMSDVLASGDYGGVLLTGLTNKQAINTAIIADMMAVIFVRGKQPREEAVELAKTNGIAILTTNSSMFEACGLLYAGGLPSHRQLQQAERSSGVNA